MNTTTLTRRAVMTAAVALPVAALPALANQAADPIIALWAERERWAEVSEQQPADDEDDGPWREWHRCGELIVDTPATTLAGVGIKCVMLIEWIGDCDDDNNPRLLRSIQADLKRLGRAS